MTRPRLATARLRLLPATEAHLDLMLELNSEPAVMRHILGRAATPGETREEWAERLGPRTDDVRGLGYWVGFEATRFVGWWGVSAFADDASLAGLGYRLRCPAWGRGLASEGARAMIAHAWTVPGVVRVVASTATANTGSRRVLEKSGLACVDAGSGERAGPLARSAVGRVVYEVGREARRERSGGQ